jgi:hypothetical protein
METAGRGLKFYQTRVLVKKIPQKINKLVVEAAGVEPASDNIPHRLLHTYPEFFISPLEASFRQDASGASLLIISPHAQQAFARGYPADRRPQPGPQEKPGGTLAYITRLKRSYNRLRLF